MLLRLILRFCLFWGVTHGIFHLELGKDTDFYWNVDYKNSEITAEVHTRNFSSANGNWIGIGFSSYGNLSDGTGDFCVVWKNLLSNHGKTGPEGSYQISDVWVDGKTLSLDLDEQQDCLDFKYLVNNGTLKWTFRRKFVTCDLNDYALEEGTTHLHWIKGNGPLFDIKGVSAKTKESGFIRVRLLKNLAPDPVLDPKTTWTHDILTAKVQVPPIETLYWCHIVKLPERLLKKKHQIVQFAVNVQKGNEELVHHMEVFHCEADPATEIPLYSGACDDAPKELSVCSRVMGAWAMGAEPLKYPKETGFPIGGPDFNPYTRLEIHYNNPKKKADWVDSSGMTFWLTDVFRQFDAGTIELGLEYSDKNSIPPQMTKFSLTGVCNTECTTVGIPPNGITVFASQLHTHLTGTRVITRHFRRRDDIYFREPALRQNNSTDFGDLAGYVELPYLNWDNHYSTHFQEIRLLKKPIKILPGDVLLTTCDFKTMDRQKMTVGGFAISDEMCVNYIHYYPRAKLEVCKSSISWTSLREYFTFMAKMDGQSIDPMGPVSVNYNGIQWTPFRAGVLSNYYNKSPIDMQCNQSDGNRFPGTWAHMSVPKFPELIPSSNPNEDPVLCPSTPVLMNEGLQYEEINTSPDEKYIDPNIFEDFWSKLKLNTNPVLQ